MGAHAKRTSTGRKRGRPRTDKERLEIATALLARLLPGEARIIQGLSRPKYRRWTDKPVTKTIYADVAAQFDVSVRYVQKSWRENHRAAIESFVDSITKRLKRQDHRYQVERKREVEKYIESLSKRGEKNK